MQCLVIDRDGYFKLIKRIQYYILYINIPAGESVKLHTSYWGTITAHALH